MRTKKGIDLNKYKLLFNEEFPESKRAILEKYVPNLVRKTDYGFCFTTEGFLVSNSILCNFV
jgi:coproporphyrinogen III oxidase-like Fe-S oxidoreductase